MTYLIKRGWKPIRNSIIQLDDGERIDLRKVQVGKVSRSRRDGLGKYGARSATYDGKVYHSTAEAKYAQDLDLRLAAGEIQKWEGQVHVPLIVNGKKICTYIVDFLVHHHDGTKEYVEIKGMLLPLGALKIKLFEALFLDDKNDKTKFTLVRV